jgi:hypothetical protein
MQPRHRRIKIALKKNYRDQSSAYVICNRRLAAVQGNNLQGTNITLESQKLRGIFGHLRFCLAEAEAFCSANPGYAANVCDLMEIGALQA